MVGVGEPDLRVSGCVCHAAVAAASLWLICISSISTSTCLAALGVVLCLSSTLAGQIQIPPPPHAHTHTHSHTHTRHALPAPRPQALASVLTALSALALDHTRNTTTLAGHGSPLAAAIGLHLERRSSPYDCSADDARAVLAAHSLVHVLGHMLCNSKGVAAGRGEGELEEGGAAGG